MDTCEKCGREYPKWENVKVKLCSDCLEDAWYKSMEESQEAE